MTHLVYGMCMAVVAWWFIGATTARNLDTYMAALLP